MTMETAVQKAQRAALAAKKAAAHPLLPVGAKVAIEAIADALEAMAREAHELAHEVKTTTGRLAEHVGENPENWEGY